MKIVSKIGKKTLVIALVGILACSFIGTAALVDYLSNEKQENVNVASPFDLQWCNHYNWNTCEITTGSWEDGVLSDDGNWAAGGEGRFWVRIENKAPTNVDASIELTIKTKKSGNYLEMTGDELSKFNIEIKNEETKNNPGSGFWSTSRNVLNQDWDTLEGWDDGKYTELVYTIPFYTVPGDTAYVAQVDFGLVSNAAPGQYEISAVVIPN
jgi:hypothetical protein